jgi:hypothetical protein
MLCHYDRSQKLRLVSCSSSGVVEELYLSTYICRDCEIGMQGNRCKMIGYRLIVSVKKLEKQAREKFDFGDA